MLKSSAICIKTHCNRPQIGTRFGPNNGVIRIKLQRFMNGNHPSNALER